MSIEENGMINGYQSPLVRCEVQTDILKGIWV